MNLEQFQDQFRTIVASHAPELTEPDPHTATAFEHQDISQTARALYADYVHSARSTATGDAKKLERLSIHNNTMQLRGELANYARTLLPEEEVNPVTNAIIADLTAALQTTFPAALPEASASQAANKLAQFQSKLLEIVRYYAEPILSLPSDAPAQGTKPATHLYERAAQELFETYAEVIERGESDPTLDTNVQRTAQIFRQTLKKAMKAAKISSHHVDDTIFMEVMDELRDILPPRAPDRSESETVTSAADTLHKSVRNHAPALLSYSGYGYHAGYDHVHIAAEHLETTYARHAGDPSFCLREPGRIPEDPHLVPFDISKQEQQLHDLMNEALDNLENDSGKSLPEATADHIMRDVVSQLRRTYPHVAVLPSRHANELLLAGLDAWKAFEQKDGKNTRDLTFDTGLQKAYPESFQALKDYAHAVDRADKDGRPDSIHHAQECRNDFDDVLSYELDDEIKAMELGKVIRAAISARREQHRAELTAPAPEIHPTSAEITTNPAPSRERSE